MQTGPTDTGKDAEFCFHSAWPKNVTTVRPLGPPWRSFAAGECRSLVIRAGRFCDAHSSSYFLSHLSAHLRATHRPAFCPPPAGKTFVLSSAFSAVSNPRRKRSLAVLYGIFRHDGEHLSTIICIFLHLFCIFRQLVCTSSPSFIRFHSLTFHGSSAGERLPLLALKPLLL